MRNAVTGAGAELRLFLRDRSNLFFVFVFPLLLVLMIGLQFGEGATSGRVAVSGAASSLQSGLVDRLEADDAVVSDPAWDDALALLARGRLDVAREHTVDDAGTLFVQNAEVHTHGFVAPDLGMTAHRNSRILRAITGREDYAVEERIAFQEFGLPEDAPVAGSGVLA